MATPNQPRRHIHHTTTPTVRIPNTADGSRRANVSPMAPKKWRMK